LKFNISLCAHTGIITFRPQSQQTFVYKKDIAFLYRKSYVLSLVRAWGLKPQRIAAREPNASNTSVRERGSHFSEKTYGLNEKIDKAIPFKSTQNPTALTFATLEKAMIASISSSRRQSEKSNQASIGFS